MAMLRCGMFRLVVIASTIALSLSQSSILDQCPDPESYCPDQVAQCDADPTGACRDVFDSAVNEMCQSFEDCWWNTHSLTRDDNILGPINDVYNCWRCCEGSDDAYCNKETYCNSLLYCYPEIYECYVDPNPDSNTHCVTAFSAIESTTACSAQHSPAEECWQEQIGSDTTTDSFNRFSDVFNCHVGCSEMGPDCSDVRNVCSDFLCEGNCDMALTSYLNGDCDFVSCWWEEHSFTKDDQGFDQYNELRNCIDCCENDEDDYCQYGECDSDLFCWAEHNACNAEPDQNCNTAFYYQYGPLIAGNTTGVCYLHPGAPGDPEPCWLEQFQHGDPGQQQYYDLDYCWFETASCGSPDNGGCNFAEFCSDLIDNYCDDSCATAVTGFIGGTCGDSLESCWWEIQQNTRDTPGFEQFMELYNCGECCGEDDQVDANCEKGNCDHSFYCYLELTACYANDNCLTVFMDNVQASITNNFTDACYPGPDLDGEACWLRRFADGTDGQAEYYTFGSCFTASQECTEQNQASDSCSDTTECLTHVDCYSNQNCGDAFDAYNNGECVSFAQCWWTNLGFDRSTSGFHLFSEMFNCIECCRDNDALTCKEGDCDMESYCYNQQQACNAVTDQNCNTAFYSHNYDDPTNPCYMLAASPDLEACWHTQFTDVDPGMQEYYDLAECWLETFDCLGKDYCPEFLEFCSEFRPDCTDGCDTAITAYEDGTCSHDLTACWWEVMGFDRNTPGYDEYSEMSNCRQCCQEKNEHEEPREPTCNEGNCETSLYCYPQYTDCLQNANCKTAYYEQQLALAYQNTTSPCYVYLGVGSVEDCWAALYSETDGQDLYYAFAECFEDSLLCDGGCVLNVCGEHYFGCLGNQNCRTAIENCPDSGVDLDTCYVTLGIAGDDGKDEYYAFFACMIIECADADDTCDTFDTFCYDYNQQCTGNCRTALDSFLAEDCSYLVDCWWELHGFNKDTPDYDLYKEVVNCFHCCDDENQMEEPSCSEGECNFYLQCYEEQTACKNSEECSFAYISQYFETTSGDGTHPCHTFSPFFSKEECWTSIGFSDLTAGQAEYYSVITCSEDSRFCNAGCFFAECYDLYTDCVSDDNCMMALEYCPELGYDLHVDACYEDFGVPGDQGKQEYLDVLSCNYLFCSSDLCDDLEGFCWDFIDNGECVGNCALALNSFLNGECIDLQSCWWSHHNLDRDSENYDQLNALIGCQECCSDADVGQSPHCNEDEISSLLYCHGELDACKGFDDCLTAGQAEFVAINTVDVESLCFTDGGFSTKEDCWTSLGFADQGSGQAEYFAYSDCNAELRLQDADCAQINCGSDVWGCLANDNCRDVIMQDCAESAVDADECWVEGGRDTSESGYDLFVALLECRDEFCPTPPCRYFQAECADSFNNCLAVDMCANSIGCNGDNAVECWENIGLDPTDANFALFDAIWECGKIACGTGCEFDDMPHAGIYLAGYPEGMRHSSPTLEKAMRECCKKDSCSGVTLERDGVSYTLRAGQAFTGYPQEMSWQKLDDVAPLSCEYDMELENYYLPFHACKNPDVKHYALLEEAQRDCCECPECNGVTLKNGKWTMRQGIGAIPNVGETSVKKIPGEVCTLSAEIPAWTLLYYACDDDTRFYRLEDAMQACCKCGADCAGITKKGVEYTIRRAAGERFSADESSWRKN